MKETQRTQEFFAFFVLCQFERSRELSLSGIYFIEVKMPRFQKQFKVIKE